MDRQVIENPAYLTRDGCRVCSKCWFGRTVEEYSRKGKVWWTCNECSSKAAARRKAQSAQATVASEAMDTHIAQCIAQLNINQQQQFALMLQQQDFKLCHQQPIEQQWQNEQRDARVTLNHILFDLEVYHSLPQGLYEQHRRLMHQTQRFFDPETLLPGLVFEQPVSHQNPQPELYVELFQTYPPNIDEGMNGGVNQGTLPDYGVLDPNFYCDLYASANAEQSGFWCDYSWTDTDSIYDSDTDWVSTKVKNIDFDQSLANALATGDLPELPEAVLLDNEDGLDLTQLPCRVDSMLLDHPYDPYMPSQSFMKAPHSSVQNAHVMDINSVGIDSWLTQKYASNTIGGVFQVQSGTPAKPAGEPRSKPATVSLDTYFADFNPSEDILRQPASLKHDLTGEPLAKHLISEIGLAIRLSELQHRWSKMQAIDKWFREVETLDRLEEREYITPWGPLSDWFAIYQVELEPILDRYGDGSSLDWQMRLKYRAENKALIKSLKDGLRKEASKLFEDNTKALSGVLVELTGQTDTHQVKIALDKQIRAMKAAIAHDCHVNKVLYLEVHQQTGAYN